MQILIILLVGKGLGKQEDGISSAIKPKLKRSSTGLGHDVAAELTDQWWSELYNKAASNLEVKDKNGKTKAIKPKEEFEITNNMLKIKRKNKKSKNEEYTDFFVKKAILTNGAARTERIESSDSEEEVVEKDVFKMTDEQLFAACEGRTAHKGARHGLKALGKLARIEQQERELLNDDRFSGYSHKKNKNKDQNLNKTEGSLENYNENKLSEIEIPAENVERIKKSKKKKKNPVEIEEEITSEKVKKKKRTIDNSEEQNDETEVVVKKAKKKKSKCSE